MSIHVCPSFNQQSTLLNNMKAVGTSPPVNIKLGLSIRKSLF
ncbi:hypothetical protein XIS1_560005 [Xenorhabdus innexi]|uniref:Uncharacterized protein n=1 Tax=Xenorhabdus innexi TaxID=290109 RepID=A0A1N6MZH8_9GAMM|nr:hypothetical protein XIS1_560005 [Xenorhabdus innexi]